MSDFQVIKESTIQEAIAAVQDLKLSPRRPGRNFFDIMNTPVKEEPGEEPTEKPAKEPRKPPTKGLTKRYGELTQDDLNYFNLSQKDLSGRNLSFIELKKAFATFLRSSQNLPAEKRKDIFSKFLAYLYKNQEKSLRNLAQSLNIDAQTVQNPDSFIESLSSYFNVSNLSYLDDKNLSEYFDLKKDNIALLNQDTFDKAYSFFMKKTSGLPDDGEIISNALKELLANNSAPQSLKNKASIFLKSKKYSEMDSDLLNYLDSVGVLEKTKANMLYKLFQEIKNSKTLVKKDSTGMLPFEKDIINKNKKDLFKKAYIMANVKKGTNKETLPDEIMDETMLLDAVQKTQNTVDHYIDLLKGVRIADTMDIFKEKLIGNPEKGIERLMPTAEEISAPLEKISTLTKELGLTSKELKRLLELSGKESGYSLAYESGYSPEEDKKPLSKTSSTKVDPDTAKKIIVGLNNLVKNIIVSISEKKDASEALKLFEKLKNDIQSIFKYFPERTQGISRKLETYVSHVSTDASLPRILEATVGILKNVLKTEEKEGLIDILLKVKETPSEDIPDEKEEEKKNEKNDKIDVSITKKSKKNPEAFNDLINTASSYLEMLTKRELDIARVLGEIKSKSFDPVKKFLDNTISMIEHLLKEPVFLKKWKGVPDIMKRNPKNDKALGTLLDEYAQSGKFPKEIEKRRSILQKMEQSNLPPETVQKEREKVKELEEEYNRKVEERLPVIKQELKRLTGIDVDREKELRDLFEEDKEKRLKDISLETKKYKEEQQHAQLIEEINDTFHTSFPVERPTDPEKEKRYDETIQAYKEKLENLYKKREDQRAEEYEKDPSFKSNPETRLKLAGKLSASDYLSKLNDMLEKIDKKADSFEKSVKQNSIMTDLNDKLKRMLSRPNEVKEEDLSTLENISKELEKLKRRFDNIDSSTVGTSVLSSVEKLFGWLAKIPNFIATAGRTSESKPTEKELLKKQLRGLSASGYDKSIIASSAIRNMVDRLIAKNAASSRGEDLTRAAFPGRVVTAPLGNKYLSKFFNSSGFEQRFMDRLMELGAHMLGNTKRKEVGGLDEIVDKAIEDASNGRFFTLDQFLGMGVVGEQALKTEKEGIDKELENLGYNPRYFDGLDVGNDLEVKAKDRDNVGKNKTSIDVEIGKEDFLEIVESYKDYLTNPLDTLKKKVQSDTEEISNDLKFLEARLNLNEEGYDNFSKEVKKNKNLYVYSGDNKLFEDFRKKYNKYAERPSGGRGRYRIAPKNTLPTGQDLNEVIDDIKKKISVNEKILDLSPDILKKPDYEVLKRKQESELTGEEYSRLVQHAKKPLGPAQEIAGIFERRKRGDKGIPGDFIRNLSIFSQRDDDFSEKTLPKEVWDELYKKEQDILNSSNLPQLLEKRRELYNELSVVSNLEPSIKGEVSLPVGVRSAFSKLYDAIRRLDDLNSSLAVEEKELSSPTISSARKKKIERDIEDRDRIRKDLDIYLDLLSKVLVESNIKTAATSQAEFLKRIRDELKNRNVVLRKIPAIKNDIKEVEKRIIDEMKKAEAAMLSIYLTKLKENNLPLTKKVKVDETVKDMSTGETKLVEKTEERPIRRYMFMSLAPFQQTHSNIKEAAGKTEKETPEGDFSIENWLKAPKEDTRFLKNYKNWVTFEDYLNTLKEKLTEARNSGDKNEIKQAFENLQVAQEFKKYPVDIPVINKEGELVQKKIPFEQIPSRFKNIMDGFFDRRSKALAKRVVKNDRVSQLAKRRIAVNEILSRSEIAKEEDRTKRITDALKKQKKQIEKMPPEEKEEIPNGIYKEINNLLENKDYSKMSEDLKSFLRSKGNKIDPVRWNTLTPRELANLKNIFWNKLYHYLDNNYWSRNMAENVIGLGPRDEAWYDNLFNAFSKYRVVFNSKYMNQLKRYREEFRRKTRSLDKEIKAIVKTINDLGIKTEDIAKYSPTAWDRLMTLRTRIEQARKSEFQYQTLLADAVAFAAKKMAKKEILDRKDKTDDEAQGNKEIREERRKKYVIDPMSKLDKYLGLDNSEYLNESAESNEIIEKIDEKAEKEGKNIENLLNEAESLLKDFKLDVKEDFNLDDLDKTIDGILKSPEESEKIKTIEDFPVTYAYVNDRSLMSNLKDRLIHKDKVRMEDITEVSQELERLEDELSTIPDSIKDPETKGNKEISYEDRINEIKNNADNLRKIIRQKLTKIFSLWSKNWIQSLRKEEKLIKNKTITKNDLSDIVDSRNLTLKKVYNTLEFLEISLPEIEDVNNEIKSYNKNISENYNKVNQLMNLSGIDPNKKKEIKKKVANYRDDKNFNSRILYGSTMQRKLKELLAANT